MTSEPGSAYPPAECGGEEGGRDRRNATGVTLATPEKFLSHRIARDEDVETLIISTECIKSCCRYVRAIYDDRDIIFDPKKDGLKKLNI